ncbi:MAG: bifunctional (p)ppGpp synthetase/guanosine-3',5'-bis(diphosphate) 3'-pyrophosphohydrolase [Clostridia bacterium]|nr:HD domain-containing protein [Lachnospiraceae bacterium]NCC01785.1 bifunctional (p)ppGpp synthetase/guanosine-3',5'-bis(diphosphate) 3'-pyrophosphohydrolase [Clostridia bacterium]NCD02997.1 bifunctional (p)ppGpp synthetase/guanosine-3',5'-bis(diphosphate) 3'-pyrophosphohydrolase [Clostridia bacterium]
MIYTPMTKKAMRIAYDAHHGQVDKTGLPYIYHPIHLAESMTDEDSTIVALLHDVIEDTALTLDDLSREGFCEDVLTALTLLTHNPAESYMDYVSRLSTSPLALRVKLADLRHNSDITRLDNVDLKAENRLKKYEKAMQLLEAVSGR